MIKNSVFRRSNIYINSNIYWHPFCWLTGYISRESENLNGIAVKENLKEPNYETINKNRLFSLR